MARRVHPRAPDLLRQRDHQNLEDAMPEVVVYALEGRSVDQKRGLVKPDYGPWVCR
jgi:hypothetical protein